jgi:transcriptional regulator of arginine metabolism
MADKRHRQAAVLELIRGSAVSSQEELRRLLLARGWDVTQATLSRDLKDLRIARVTTEQGVRYVVPSGAPDDAKPSLGLLLPQLFGSVDGVRELAVLRTRPGGAQPIAEAIDAEGWPEVLGTLGGENTILIVCRSEDARQLIQARIQELSR